MKSIFILLSLLSAQAFAQQNLPNFSDLRSIGRVPAFASPRGMTWFLPTAFRTELSCSPAAATRSCIVKVFNALSQSEISSLEKIVSAVRSGAAGVTPINPAVVASVKESFLVALNELQTTEAKLQTLMMNERAPYASLAIRGDGRSIAQLEESFAAGGIGTFESQVVMNVENVGDYLAIRNGDVLAQMLISLKPNLSKQEMLQAISSIAQKLDLQIYGLARQDALYRTVDLIRSRFFSMTRSRGYSFNRVAIPQTIVIQDEHTAPFQARCIASIPLQANAQVKVTCEEMQ